MPLSDVELKDLDDLRWIAGAGHSLDPTLLSLLSWAAGQFRSLGKNFVVTSLNRPDGPGKIHDTNPLRAFDCRCNHLTEAERSNFSVRATEAWIYDTDRPDLSVLLHHDVGQGDHFHFQVHPNTIRRG